MKWQRSDSSRVDPLHTGAQTAVEGRACPGQESCGSWSNRDGGDGDEAVKRGGRRSRCWRLPAELGPTDAEAAACEQKQ